MNIAVIAFTDRGAALGRQLAQGLERQGDRAICSTAHGAEKISAREWTEQCFAACDALVYVGAAGIAVRLIAPHLVSKVSDPAVLCMDEAGRFVVPLVSGHLGGANALALRTAALVGAQPVLTTATDVRGAFAVDLWAKTHGLRLANPAAVKTVSARLLEGGPVRLRSSFPVRGGLPAGVELTSGGDYDVLVTCKRNARRGALLLVPPAAALGVGCRRQTDPEALEQAFAALLAKGSIHPLAVAAVCSIDLKAGEPGLLEFCRRHGLSLRTYSARELAAVKGSFSSSAFVQKITGVDNVCERSAVLGADGGTLLLKKAAGNGVTMALAVKPITLDFGEWL